VVTCSSCGNEVPEGSRFCNVCGAALVEAPAAAALEERKVVSVLFCDLVGFTATSEQQDPEDVQARIRPYQARLRYDIERYGGTMEKFVGDAVMAVFGAPVAHEDDAERAVRAGLTILDSVAELNEADPGLALQVRIGINTGEAVVSLEARPELGEGMVAGDVVNTAARIQAAAPVNAVAVSEQTYQATSRVFDYVPLDAVSVKGKAESLVLWRPKAARARFGSDITRQFKTPLVGRELEKPLLIGIFERTAQQRSVQLVTIVGEPGVGKTRLIGELLGHIEVTPGIIRWRQGRCLPYGEGITFWALGEIVKAEAGILESDSSETAAAKLDAAIPPEEPDRQWLARRLAPLVGAESAPPAERQELFTAWRRFLEGLAAFRTTVLVVEDLHWADEALLAFLEYLAEWSEGVPLLIVCAARPELYERRPGWGAGHRNAHVINLSPLSDQETGELVANLIGATVLTPDFRDAILERAGGNPLYAEEFVRLLADRGGLDPANVLLPDTVQALIAARLDTLVSDRKSLLQDAAVVGKVFWAGALSEIGDRDPGDVELALHELARKELVRTARTSSMEGESEYAFSHQLVRDVAYAQIPRTDRARRHRAAAAWIEHRAGERVEDMAEMLAHHYLQALELSEAAGETGQAEELRPQAREFLALAGERALALDAAQAEARLARALELTPTENPTRPALVVRWANTAFQTGRLGEAAEALDAALASFRARGDAKATAEALQLRSRVGMRLGEPYLALAAEAVTLLEREPPGPTLVAAQAQLANSHFIAGQYADAITAAERALTLADSLRIPEPARALGYRGVARAYLGDANGIADMERALELLLTRGAAQDAAVVQNNLPVVRYLLDGPAQALGGFEQGIAFCRERGLDHAAMVCETNCPGLLVELGRPHEALELARRVASTAEAMGETYDLVELHSVEIATSVALGAPISRNQVDTLVSSARASGGLDPVVLGLATAATALVNDAPNEASALLEELAAAEGARETTYYRRQLPMMVRTALAAGDDALARHLAGQLESRYPVDEHALCVTRAQLEEHAGRHRDAATLYTEAAERWHSFGNTRERAYALLGQGRCLVALSGPGGEEPLRETRQLFKSMGYKPALAETDALLAQTTAAAS
jgi:class 3 adenylate cyclase/tetratricopeptide (TPR) repeat protein